MWDVAHAGGLQRMLVMQGMRGMVRLGCEGCNEGMRQVPAREGCRDVGSAALQGCRG